MSSQYLENDNIKLCWRALAIFHMQKCCSRFPQSFYFKCNLHCQLICDGNPKWIFFVEKLEPLPFLTIFKGSFKFCEYCKIWCQKEKVARALLSKSLMDFLSKWNLQGAAAPVFFRFYSNANPNNAVCANLDAQFWKRKWGSLAIKASKSSNL